MRSTTLATRFALASLLVALTACSDVQFTPPDTTSCDDANTRCDDDNECTFDDCDPRTGECVYANTPDGTECGDDEQCSAGICGVSAGAVAFCQQYEDTCGFGGPGRYADSEACQSEYDGFAENKQRCVEQHLGFAGASEPEVHCPHANGAPPCDI